MLRQLLILTAAAAMVVACEKKDHAKDPAKEVDKTHTTATETKHEMKPAEAATTPPATASTESPKAAETVTTPAAESTESPKTEEAKPASAS